MEQFRTPVPQAARRPESALDELHLEFEDIRVRCHETPEVFIVLSEIMAASARDTTLAKIMRGVDQAWSGHLGGILERGVTEGVFRKGLDVNATAKALMIQLQSVTHLLQHRHADVDEFITQLWGQVEAWVSSQTRR